MTNLNTLDEWLAYIEARHPQSIAMGLDRVDAVRREMGLVLDCPVIVVAGTNGKGSACRLLESVLTAAGYRTGVYTSPHLLRYNERVRVSGADVSDVVLVKSLREVEAARARTGVSLTYFEFGTLSAARIFREAAVEVAVLEVGLGGRLDAVNVFDGDVSMLMSVDLDHQAYLGPTRETIGLEKAHVFRPQRVAVCADPDPPTSVLKYAESVGATLWLAGRDYGYAAERSQWRYWSPMGNRPGLSLPALRGRYQIANAAACLAALESIRDRLPVSGGAIRDGLASVTNPGRFEVLPGRPVTILDVAHNPHASAALASNLAQMSGFDRTIAVFGALSDKDIGGVVRPLRGHVDRWLLVPLAGDRGLPVEALAERVREAGVTAGIENCVGMDDAITRAYEQAQLDDRILVFGSFLTVAAAMQALQARRQQRRS
jgi:dihydrofolate synthase/folylpolyglutamate synthase